MDATSIPCSLWLVPSLNAITYAWLIDNDDAGSIRHFLVHEMNIVEAMIYIFQNCRPLSDHVLTCLGTMICAGTCF